jgi:8-oxo-dGTP pyrophosphatase MutT (NUDIX family)
MKKLRDATLLFLVRRHNGQINEICLAMKKRGFGAGRWNGVGGKVEEEELEAAARREAKEEINASVGNCKKMAELAFCFPHNPDWDQLVHVYFSSDWKGRLRESEEMSPKWFFIPEIPFGSMWPDDIFWLPQVLKGNLIKAAFEFGERDMIRKKVVRKVDILGDRFSFI